MSKFPEVDQAEIERNFQLSQQKRNRTSLTNTDSYPVCSTPASTVCSVLIKSQVTPTQLNNPVNPRGILQSLSCAPGNWLIS